MVDSSADDIVLHSKNVKQMVTVLFYSAVNLSQAQPSCIVIIFYNGDNMFLCSCDHSDCEAEPTSPAAGRRKQGTLQARGDPVFCYCGILAHQHLDLVSSLRWDKTESPKTLEAKAISC